MRKIKPIIDLPPGTKTLWHTLAEYMGRAREIFGHMMDGMKKTTVDRGYPELTDGFDIQGLMAENIYKYLSEFQLAKAQGKTVTLYNFCIAPEIFNIMDTYPLCQEIGSIALSLANIGSVMTEYIDLAIEAGLSAHECNAQKVWIGAILKGEAPKPDALVYGSQPCDSANIQYQIMQTWYDIPTFTMDIPTWSHIPDNQYFDENVAPYMGKQLKKLVGFLEKVTGKKADNEKLKSVLIESNKSREYLQECNEYMKHTPSPLPGLVPLFNYGLMISSAGLPRVTEYCKFQRDFAKKAVKKGIGAIDLFSGGKREEKLRVYWTIMPVIHDWMLFDWIEQKFGAQIIMDIPGKQILQPVDLSSEDSMFEGMGKTSLDLAMARQNRGPMEFYIDEAIRTVKEYKIDCVIVSGHVGCKHIWGGTQMLLDLLKEETGVPCLLFEVDIVDPRHVKSRVYKRRIKSFLEGLQ